MELLRSPTDRSAWGITARKESCCYRTRLCHGLWKKRGLEKSKNRLSHPAWKSRNVRGIPTFPQPRLRLKFKNRTDRVLRKADILICYEHACWAYVGRMKPPQPGCMTMQQLCKVMHAGGYALTGSQCGRFLSFRSP